jgi:hypothetical protein
MAFPRSQPQPFGSQAISEVAALLALGLVRSRRRQARSGSEKVTAGAEKPLDNVPPQGRGIPRGDDASPSRGDI